MDAVELDRFGFVKRWSVGFVSSLLTMSGVFGADIRVEAPFDPNGEWRMHDE